MTDAVQLFEDLGRRGYEPRLRKMTGRVRFDLTNGPDTDSWLVTIDNGNVAVSHERGPADCTMRGTAALFDRLAGGTANVMAAVLRGALVCRGEVDLLIAVQRIFPARQHEPEFPSDARSAS